MKPFEMPELEIVELEIEDIMFESLDEGDLGEWN